MSKITTHVLDTSIGKPAVGISVSLEQDVAGRWNGIAKGITDRDGRANNLLPIAQLLYAGVYRLVFDTAFYFKKQNIKTFYPKIVIEFEINETGHYHVPLLLSPFGYSTYRGS